MNNMHVVIVIPGSLPITYYGGTQRVMWSLAKALAERGCCVSLFADQVLGKCPFAYLYQLDKKKPFHEQVPANADIIHFNNEVMDGENLDFPCVVTIHGNGKKDALHPNSIFVSQNHAQRHGCHSYVYNGIDWDSCPPIDLSLPRQGYHFLGKAAWSVKNVRGAIDVVKKLPTGHLTVIGGHRLNFKMGFRWTFSPRVNFIGMADDAIKYRVMQQSKGLIFPVTWHEPFGLAIIESLYAGCPVFATPYGAIPELISNPNLGFLTDSIDVMTEHLRHPIVYDVHYCHQYAKEHFNAQVMASNYIAKYEQVLRGAKLNPVIGQREPTYRDLPWQ